MGHGRRLRNTVLKRVHARTDTCMQSEGLANSDCLDHHVASLRSTISPATFTRRRGPAGGYAPTGIGCEARTQAGPRLMGTQAGDAMPMPMPMAWDQGDVQGAELGRASSGRIPGARGAPGRGGAGR